MAQKLKLSERTPAERAHRLMVEAAIIMTRLKSTIRKACLMILCDGLSMSEVVKRTGKNRNHIYKSLRVVRAKLVEVKAQVYGN